MYKLTDINVDIIDKNIEGKDCLVKIDIIPFEYKQQIDCIVTVKVSCNNMIRFICELIYSNIHVIGGFSNNKEDITELKNTFIKGEIDNIKENMLILNKVI